MLQSGDGSRKTRPRGKSDALTAKLSAHPFTVASGGKCLRRGPEPEPELESDELDEDEPDLSESEHGGSDAGQGAFNDDDDDPVTASELASKVRSCRVCV